MTRGRGCVDLRSFNDLFWEGFRRIPSGASVLFGVWAGRQYYFLFFFNKLIKEAKYVAAAMQSGFGCLVP